MSTLQEIKERNDRTYEYLKIFCEEIPYEKLNKNMIKTNISITKSIDISREVVKKITPDLIKYYDKYIEKVIIEKGNNFFSEPNKIYYEENIIDIYVLIHEFYHYYVSKICQYGLNGIPYILDESKSIMTEMLARDILKDMNLNIPTEEIDYFRYIRLIDERKNAGKAVFLHNIYEIDENEDKTQEEIINIFQKKDKKSIEYITFKENIEDKIFILLGNKVIYLKKYDEVHFHPISYLIALDMLRDSKKILESIFELFKKYSNQRLYQYKIVEQINEDFNYSIIKNAKIDTTKTEEIRKILKNELRGIKNECNR